MKTVAQDNSAIRPICEGPVSDTHGTQEMRRTKVRYRLARRASRSRDRARSKYCFAFEYMAVLARGRRAADGSSQQGRPPGFGGQQTEERVASCFIRLFVRVLALLWGHLGLSREKGEQAGAFVQAWVEGIRRCGQVEIKLGDGPVHIAFGDEAEDVCEQDGRALEAG